MLNDVIYYLAVTVVCRSNFKEDNMIKYADNQYTMQTYFKSLCDSFYIAYKELERIGEEDERLAKIDPQKELEMVKELLKISELEEAEEFQGKYISQKYSRKELEEKKNELKKLNKQHENACEKLEGSSKFWTDLLVRNIEEISRVLKKMQKKGFSVIVTNKEEIIALMNFFSSNSVKEYRIINIKEECLMSFPSGDDMYNEFYNAYCLGDDSKMKEVYEKYF